jgi:DNA-directed RNA polymerase subunit E"
MSCAKKLLNKLLHTNLSSNSRVHYYTFFRDPQFTSHILIILLVFQNTFKLGFNVIKIRGVNLVSKKPSKAFKACLKCKALVAVEVETCPICGSKDFSTEWSGIIIVLDPEKSVVAKLLGIKTPGRYAIKVGA